MTTSRAESNRETAEPAADQAIDLPDWLKALQTAESPDDGPASLDRPAAATDDALVLAATEADLPLPADETPPGWIASPAALASDMAANPAQPGPAVDQRPSTFLGEEDLPDWLKALADPPEERMPAPPPARPAPTRPAVPAWVTVGAETGPAAESGPAVEPEEVPPVWMARSSRPQPEVTTGAALFASLAEAPVSGTPVEEQAPPPPPVPGFQWWYLAIPALVVLAIVVAVVLKMAM